MKNTPSISFLQHRHFIYGLLGICCFYLGFELFFNAYAMISVDEFWYAHNAYQFKAALPYRDFAPYKTVLGYYFLLIPMLMTKGTLSTLIFTKNIIAILNALILFFCSLWLTRFFTKNALLSSLLALIVSDIMLSFSTNIRVDLFAYWFCFFSLLSMLNKRFILAGLWMGLGFITSQKAIWYIFASNGACIFYWLVMKNHFTSKISIKAIFYFNFTLVLMILSYLIIWSFIANWPTVTHSLFHEAFAIYQLDTYSQTRKIYWSYTLLYNPLLFLLWPLTLLSIFVTYTQDTSYPYRFFIVIYAFFILLCLIPYKQVFPYYMQVTIPLLLVLYAAFFTWIGGLFQSNPSIQIKWIGKKGIWLFTCCYMITVCFVDWTFALPTAYLLIDLIPLLLLLRITQHKTASLANAPILLKLIVITGLFIGIIYPLCLYSIKVIQLNGSYQKANIEAANDLLQDGSHYVAGIELIYNKNQPIIGLRHLMAPAVQYLYSPTPKLKQVMLASLYEDPSATISSIMADLKKSPIKFYINNYRIMALPRPILDLLHHDFVHFWGSIYLYAPTISAGTHQVTLKFTGKYCLDRAAQVNLNGIPLPQQAVLFLKKGTYFSQADHTYRLRFIPGKLNTPLIPSFQPDNWEKIIF